jgi:asparagine synthase (glutamine-hydrolysing)
MSQHTSTPIQTFTVGFEGGEDRNETRDARALADEFGASHSEMIVGPSDYEKYYERFLWDLEEPVGHEAAPAFFFVSQMASRSVKVALCGQGADEPWAGYRRYLGVSLSGIYARAPRVLTEHIVRPVIERYSRNELLRRGVGALSEPDMLSRFVSIYSFFTSSMKARLYQPWLRDALSSDGLEARGALQWLHRDVAELDPLTQILFIDTRASLPDDLLMVGDKTSMANSLEVRVPYLDHRLIQLIETFPPRLKIRRLRGKYLHKKAVSKWVPRTTIRRVKKGFDNPLEQWTRDVMRRYTNECLMSERAAVRRYFNPDFIRQLLADHESGRQNYLRHLNLLICFELWHQRFLPN